MPRRAWAYIWAIYLIAGSSVSGALLLPQISSPAWLGLEFIVVLLLAILAQRFKAVAPSVAPANQTTTSYSATLVFLFAGVILLPPLLFALLVIIAHSVEWAWERWQRSTNLTAWYIQPFNIAVHIIAGTAAQGVLLLRRPIFETPPDLAAVGVGMAAALIYLVLNHGLVAQALVLARGISWQASGIFDGDALLSDGLNLCLGYSIAMLWTLSPWLLVPALAPLVLIYRALLIPQIKQAAQIALDQRSHELQQSEHERHQLEAQLALHGKLMETQKLEGLGRMAGGIAHDFNNLLMPILGNAELALASLPTDTPAKHSIEHIKLAAQRAAELVNQLLAYAGKGHFVMQPLDLNALVREMLELLATALSVKAARLRYQPAHELPVVIADDTQIRQVVMNLVINAAEAIGDETGTITISTGTRQIAADTMTQGIKGTTSLPAGVYVYLEVVDTGCGMDPATQAQIFEPFFTTKFTGRGLGLAAVLGIVHSHQGAMHIQSVLGAGTTFTVLLPAAAPAASIRPTRPTNVKDVNAPSTILVVDDDADVRMVVVAMLERFGFTVLVADSGQAGLDCFRTNVDTIDCILLDLTMPQMNGEQVFHAVRQIKPGVRVMLMSGYTEDEMANRFVGQAIDGLLHKPFTLSEMRTKIQHVLAK